MLVKIICACERVFVNGLAAIASYNSMCVSVCVCEWLSCYI